MSNDDREKNVFDLVKSFLDKGDLIFERKSGRPFCGRGLIEISIKESSINAVARRGQSQLDAIIDGVTAQEYEVVNHNNRWEGADQAFFPVKIRNAVKLSMGSKYADELRDYAEEKGILKGAAMAI